MGLSKNHLYSEDFNYLALLFRTLGHGARLHIVEYLGDHGSATNKELVQYLGGLGQSTVSQHCQILLKMDLITATPMDNAVIYSINVQKWENLRACAREFGKAEQNV